MSRVTETKLAIHYRDSLWECIKERRVYGTTGQRIILDVTVNETPMGGTSSLGPDEEVRVKALVHGTAPITTIDLFKDGRRIDRQEYTDQSDQRVEIE